MSTENTATEVAPVEDNLDVFAADFFGQKEVAPEPASSDAEVVEDAPLEDTQPEVDTLEKEDETVEEPPKEAPKKNRFQERIDELTAGKREAERKAQELSDRLSAMESTKQNSEPEKPATGPDPYDKNEDGSDVYPLGEFDPKYLKDFTTHLFKQQMEEEKVRLTAESKEARMKADHAALQESWESKLEPARERYPDFAEKGDELVAVFSNIDQDYGEYLATQIMDLDNGPDVLYYLANNPDEAEKIVNAGARKASVALGRLDAKFDVSEEEKQTPRPKVSQAPTPPPTNRGATPASLPVLGDTDDLDAFSRELFKKR